jgi:hypothetical protein
MKLHNICGIFAILGLGATPAQADLIAQTQLCPDRAGNNCSLDSVSLASGTATLQNNRHVESDSALPDATPVHSVFDSTATAAATYGILKASSTLTLTDYRAGTYWLDEHTPGAAASLGIAIFTDALTISGAAGDGILHITIHVSGSLNNPFGNTFQTTNQSSLLINGGGFGLGDGESTLEFEIPFTFGQALSLSVELDAGLSPFDAPGYISDPYAYSGTADFSHTVEIRQFEIRNAAGAPVHGVAVSADSGAVYALSAANQIPEPTSLSLVGFAFGVIALSGRRCKALRS